MKKQLLIITTCVLGFTSLAMANTSTDFTQGFYAGLQAGLGVVDEGNGYNDYTDFIAGGSTDAGYIQPGSIFASSKDTSQKGFSGRISLGYSFIPYFSVETGYTFYNKNFYKANADYWQGGSQEQVTEDIKFKTWSWDLVGKGIFPINDHWQIYAKAGFAYVRATAFGEITNSGDWSILKPVPFTIDTAQSEFRPTYGLGVTYKLNSNLAADLSWMEIYGKNKISYDGTSHTLSNTDVAIPTIDNFMLGLTYKF